MKKIEALIKPSKVEAVREALATLGINGVTISEVRCCGHRNGLTETESGGQFAADVRPKAKLEVVVTDAASDAVCSAIVEAARSGSIYDGSIYVLPVEEAIRIRTRETAEMALG
jgi:nitrogen regulatory protein P-II 1